MTIDTINPFAPEQLGTVRGRVIVPEDTRRLRAALRAALPKDGPAFVALGELRDREARRLASADVGNHALLAQAIGRVGLLHDLLALLASEDRDATDDEIDEYNRQVLGSAMKRTGR
jgi:hypothetical protein